MQNPERLDPTRRTVGEQLAGEGAGAAPRHPLQRPASQLLGAGVETHGGVKRMATNQETSNKWDRWVAWNLQLI